MLRHSAKEQKEKLTAIAVALTDLYNGVLTGIVDLDLVLSVDEAESSSHRQTIVTPSVQLSNEV